MTLELEVVAESLVPGEHVTPAYDEDDRFNHTWWHDGTAKSPVSYCALREDGEEVARAKILPASRAYGGYTTWTCPPAGATEIDLIEVRQDLRGSEKQYGRHAVLAIVAKYGRPVMAMSLDEASDGFWEALGWTAHRHPDGDHYRLLFTSR